MKRKKCIKSNEKKDSHGKKGAGGGGKGTPPPKKRVWGDKVTEEEQRELDRSRPNDNNSPLRLDSSTPIDKINLDDEILSDGPLPLFHLLLSLYYHFYYYRHYHHYHHHH